MNSTDPSAPQDRPAVLILLGCYLPGYKGGGPIRSIENLVEALGGEFSFRIVTLDRDLGDQSPYAGIARNRWVSVGQAEVMYLAPGLRGFLAACALLRTVDRGTRLYVNSFFATRFSILPVLLRWLKLCRPRYVVLAPRGEFSPGALHLKRFRKHLYIRIAQWLGLYRDVIWQATSTLESRDIRRQFPAATNVAVAGVIASPVADRNRASQLAAISDPPAAPGQGRRIKKPGELHAVFVSRVSRKKNLSGALRLLARASGNVFFDIYGPAEDREYFKECQNEIAALPPNIQARYCGEIAHEKIGQVFANHDLFLFPTLGENYGHVICEALLAGCPVLVSDQTPWRNLEAAGVGWDIPLSDAERFRSALAYCVNADAACYAGLKVRAMEYAAKHASAPETIGANRRLLQGALLV